MTETNETGRQAKTNRKVVVTGSGSLCQEFLYKGLKFDPKTMIFTKEGKTLDTDYDVLENWLEKRCNESSLPSSSAVASGSAMAAPSSISYPQVSPHANLQYHPNQAFPVFSPQPFLQFPFSQQLLQTPPNLHQIQGREMLLHLLMFQSEMNLLK